MGTAPLPVTAAADSGASATTQPELFAGDVTSPAGFRAAGVHCGLKKSNPDLALVVG